VEVLRLVARGESNGAIAAALRISEKTVRNHVEHIYTKIDVNNRTGASSRMAASWRAITCRRPTWRLW
jgi:DNA-binding NarL/FixJ family response regulator